MFLLKIYHYTNKAFYPLTISLVIIGTILNLYCLFYFLQIQRRNCQNIYLSALSISDTIDLHLNITLPVLRQLPSFDDYFRHSFKICRLIGVLNEFFLIFPTWILILIIIERLRNLLQSIKTSATHAKRSLIFLSILVTMLSLYRFVDLKGIDQISVFSVVACSGTHRSLMIIRNFNLIIWIMVPNCSTLIMCFLIVYSNKFKTHQNPSQSSKYHRTTKIVLFLSILTVVCHTPIGKSFHCCDTELIDCLFWIGILHALDMIYSRHEEIYIFLTIILVRKLSFILYQISLCSKFLIYNKMFADFKYVMLLTSMLFLSNYLGKLSVDRYLD